MTTFTIIVDVESTANSNSCLQMDVDVRRFCSVKREYQVVRNQMTEISKLAFALADYHWNVRYSMVFGASEK